MPNATNVIYFDEAGYTGGDLLNAEQKYFVMGSTSIDEQSAQEMIEEAIRRFKLQVGAELKGATLIRSGTGRMAIKWLMEECDGHFHIVYNEKLYAIAAKFFEAFIEPLIAAHSTVFYRTGFHQFISNAIYYGLRTRNKYAVETIENVQTIFRRNEEKVPALFDPTNIKPGELISTVLQFCRLNESTILPLIKEYSDRSLYKWYLDLSVSSLHTSLNYWGKRYPEIDVVCDESKPIAENKDIAVLSGRAAEGIKILRPTEMANYKVNSLTFGKSHEHYSLQLADLFASSVGSSLHRGDKFFEDVVQDHRSAFDNFNVIPSTEFIDLKNEAAVKNSLVLLSLIGASRNPGGLVLTSELGRQIESIHAQNIDALRNSLL